MSTLMICGIVYVIGLWVASFIGSYTNTTNGPDDWLMIVCWPFIVLAGTFMFVALWPTFLGDYMRERAQKKRQEKVQRERAAEKEAARTETSKTN